MAEVQRRDFQTRAEGQGGMTLSSAGELGPEEVATEATEVRRRDF